MPVYKDDNNGTFYVQCYYRDARGSKRHKTKRGFSSEVEAAVWESQFKSLNGGAMDNGTFYVQCYYRDARGSKRHKTKRGFSSEVEAAVWESQFKSLNGGAMDMTFLRGGGRSVGEPVQEP